MEKARGEENDNFLSSSPRWPKATEGRSGISGGTAKPMGDEEEEKERNKGGRVRMQM